MLKVSDRMPDHILMKKYDVHFLFSVFSMFVLSACSEQVLFRTKPCEEGMVREGSACVDAKKDGIVECKDPDLNKLQKGEIVTLCDGSIGEGQLVIPSDCTNEDQQNCVVNGNFKVANTNNFTSSDIKSGKVIAGITGTYKYHRQCRNYSSIANFDSSYPPSDLGWNTATFAPAAVNTTSNQITFGWAHGLITNSPLRFSTSNILPTPLVAGTTYYAIYVSNTVIQLASSPNGTQIDLTSQGVGTHTAHDAIDNTAQYYDTIDDRNSDLATGPTDSPWGSSDYLCDSSNFTNVTSNAAPLLPSGLTPATGNKPFTQIWYNQISGMYISNILYDSVPNNRSWSDAVLTCETLNGGTAGNGWRLPTQKELIQLYIHGITRVSLSGGFIADFFWSSSAVSYYTSSAWVVFLSNGYVTHYPRNLFSNSVICIR